MEIGEVERTVLAMLMKVGREALASYLDEKGTGYRGEEIVNAQGETLPYVRDRKCAYRSVHGVIEIVLTTRQQARRVFFRWRMKSTFLKGVIHIFFRKSLQSLRSTGVTRRLVRFLLIFFPSPSPSYQLAFYKVIFK